MLYNCLGKWVKVMAIEVLPYNFNAPFTSVILIGIVLVMICIHLDFNVLCLVNTTNILHKHRKLNTW